MDDLLHWFSGNPETIKQHLQQAACIIAGSKEFKVLPATERSNWLFRQFQLINYFDSQKKALEQPQDTTI